MIRTGSDFSGVGAFDQALMRLNIDYKTIFACDMDKFARQTYIENYGMPDYYPENVYDRQIPNSSLDIYMTSPSCQSFSIAGKRKGENSDNGILFYNSLEFIKENKPRFFIFENVKGLLSDANGKTYGKWIDLLGGKSVDGNAILFPNENSVPYHIYAKVLNAKHYGVPQNRERIFIVGIRDDIDNTFSWPKPVVLKKRLKDILETNVEDKYFLSEKMIKGFVGHNVNHNEKKTGFIWKPKDVGDIANCLRANAALCPTDNSIKIGFEIATTEDSINFSNLKSKTKRGRVGKGVAQTLSTDCSLGIIQLNDPKHSNDRIYSENGISPTLNTMQGGNRQLFVKKEFRIRKLTPRECFRLMDFPDTFKMPCSNSQMYKQAGNSIVVAVLVSIINNLNL